MDIWIGFPIWNNHSIDYEIFFGTMNSMEIWSMEIVDLYTCMIPKSSMVAMETYINLYDPMEMFKEHDLWID